ncbi:Zinc finger CCHC-type [Trinorchestia longiramus]|nr:Zinc finger CCHC-type [Trinorchestia longiramus]
MFESLVDNRPMFRIRSLPHAETPRPPLGRVFLVSPRHESKEWYNFIQGNNRGSEGQIHELVVEGCKVSDRRQMESIPDELNVPHTYVGFTRYAVFPFNAPPRRCYRCQRLGHVAVNCNSPLHCLVCSDPHTKDECTAEPGQEICANCHQTCIESSKECPAIRNAAAIQKLQCSGVGFEAAKDKVMKTQTELATKAPFMMKQNLTVPIVSSNIMGSQHSIQGNQQENQTDLIIQEVMVDIHQSGGSSLWSTAHSTDL